MTPLSILIGRSGNFSQEYFLAFGGISWLLGRLEMIQVDSFFHPKKISMSTDRKLYILSTNFNIEILLIKPPYYFIGDVH